MNYFRTVVREAKTEKGLGWTYYVQRFEDIDHGMTFERVEHPVRIVHHKRNEVTHRKVWTCNCPDFTERKVFKNGECTHILAVQEYRQKLRDLIISYQQNPELIFKQAFAAQAEPAPESEQLTAEQTILRMPSADLIRGIVSRFNARDGFALWKILTALRGPDSGDDNLKYQTTSTLRALIGMKNDGGSTGAIVKECRPLGYDAPDHYAIQDAVSVRFPESQYHFRNHYALALETLKELGFKFGS